MSDPMLGRLARALRAELLAMESVELTDEEAKRLATVALRTIRQPDNRMLHAAAKSLSPTHRPTPNRVSVKAKHGIRFRAMIDAVLETSP